MIRFFVRRLLEMVPLLILLSLLIFVLFQLIPGDYLSEMALNPSISRQTIEDLRRDYGLDKPFYIQYFLWLRELFPRQSRLFVRSAASRNRPDCRAFGEYRCVDDQFAHFDTVVFLSSWNLRCSQPAPLAGPAGAADFPGRSFSSHCSGLTASALLCLSYRLVSAGRYRRASLCGAPFAGAGHAEYGFLCTEPSSGDDRNSQAAVCPGGCRPRVTGSPCYFSRSQKCPQSDDFHCRDHLRGASKWVCGG